MVRKYFRQGFLTIFNFLTISDHFSRLLFWKD